MARTVRTQRKTSNSHPVPAVDNSSNSTTTSSGTTDILTEGAGAATNSATTSSHMHSSTNSDTPTLSKSTIAQTTGPVASDSQNMPAGGETRTEVITQDDKVDERGEAHTVPSATFVFSAAILPCLRAHSSSVPIECPWNPRTLSNSRVKEIRESLIQNQQSLATAVSLDGPGILLAITTMTTTEVPNEFCLKPVIVNTQDSNITSHYEAKPLTTEVLLKAISWVKGEQENPDITTTPPPLEELLQKYIQVLETHLDWRKEQDIAKYNEYLKSFIMGREWNSSNEEEKSHMLKDKTRMYERLDFIYRHLAHQTKVVAHVVNGQHTALALEEMLRNFPFFTKYSQRIHGIHGHQFLAMCYLPQQVDKKFETTIQAISCKHQENSSKRVPHSVLHLLNNVIHAMNKSTPSTELHPPVLKVGLQSVYEDVKQDRITVGALKEQVCALGVDAETAEQLMKKYVHKKYDTMSHGEMVNLYIKMWIDITAQFVWKALTPYETSFSSMAGFSFPSKDDFLTSLSKYTQKKKLVEENVLMPTSQLLSTVIRDLDGIYSYDKNQYHRKNAFYQLLMWSRLSPITNKEIGTMIDNLSQQNQLSGPKANVMLWNFYHSVVDSVSISFPIWSKVIYRGAVQKSQKNVQAAPSEVLKFCLLVSAINRSTNAFKKQYPAPTEEKHHTSHLKDFLEENPIEREDFLHEFEDIPDELWERIRSFYREFFSEDEFTFITVAHCLYLKSKLSLDDIEEKAKEGRALELLEEGKHPRPPYNSNPFNDENPACPFGDTENQIACLGETLSDFSVRDVSAHMHKFLVIVARNKHQKSLVANKRKQHPTATSTTTVADIDQGLDRTTTGAEIDQGLDEDASEGPVEEVLGLAEDELVEDELSSQGVKAKHRAAHNRDEGHLDGQTTTAASLSEKSSVQNKSSAPISNGQKEGNRKQGNQKPKRKRQQVTPPNKKPKAPRIHVSKSTDAAIGKVLSFADQFSDTTIPNYRSYLDYKDPDSLVLQEFQHILQRVKKLSQNKKVSGRKVDAAPVLNRRGWNADSAVLSGILAVERTGADFDQNRALLETERAGDGADDESSEPDPQDDTYEPYDHHPYIDSEAQETTGDEHNNRVVHLSNISVVGNNVQEAADTIGDRSIFIGDMSSLGSNTDAAMEHILSDEKKSEDQKNYALPTGFLMVPTDVGVSESGEERAEFRP